MENSFSLKTVLLLTAEFKIFQQSFAFNRWVKIFSSFLLLTTGFKIFQLLLFFLVLRIFSNFPALNRWVYDFELFFAYNSITGKQFFLEKRFCFQLFSFRFFSHFFAFNRWV